MRAPAGHPPAHAFVAVSALLALVALAACDAPPPPPATTAPPAFGLAGDRFWNADAGYSVAMPPGWTLRPASDASLVVFDRDAGEAAFSLLALADGDSAARRVEATIANFEASGASVGVERVEREIGSGQDALPSRGFVGRGASGGGEIVLRMFGADRPGRGGLVLVFEATPAADEATGSARAAILAGFRLDDGVRAR